MKVSVIIVNYNQWHFLERCLKSLFEQTKGVDLEIIVVDNGSSDGSPECIAREYPKVDLVASGQNLGFARGNNVGIRRATGTYVLMLNPDTEILGDAVTRVAAFLDAHPQAGIAGCRLLGADGATQETLATFPSLWNLFCEATFLATAFPRSRLFGRYHLTYVSHASELQVDWLCGAFLMIRRKVFETVGLLDEQFFMYSEEVDFCMRAKQAGFEVWYTPSASIMHFWGGMNDLNQRVVIWTYGSQIILFRKHFHGIHLGALLTLKYLGMLLRTAAYGFMGLVGGNNMLKRKSAMYGKALRTLLTERWEYNREGSVSPEPWKLYS